MSMLMKPGDDLKGLIVQIQELVSDNHPNSEDDLESLLTWLNPNEPHSNHQCKPPTLRLKNTIKTLINQYYNGQFSEDDKEAGYTLVHLLKLYYIYQVRLHFFGSLSTLQTFKNVQRLVQYYEFPLKYIYLFEDCPEEWITERDGLMHYLLNRHRALKENVATRLGTLVMEDDFDLALVVVNWLNEARSNVSSIDILLDLIVEKVSRFCQKHMTGVWHNRFLIMETFNQFITNYWSHICLLLGCPEDNHELTTAVYHLFERQFIQLRTKEIFDIVVKEYPSSKPTILELRKVLVKSKDLTEIVVEFLSNFEKHILNPSITTVNALLAYVKTVKAFLTLDPTGRCLYSISAFVKPYFQERNDLVTVLLYAILELQSEEFEGSPEACLDLKSLNNLSQELRDPEFGIESTLELVPPADSYSRPASTPDSEPHLLYKDVIESFLQWVPEPMDTISKSYASSLCPSGNLLDILMEMFESKDFFVSEFLALLTRKLLALKMYTLDRKWSHCLRLLKTKFSPTTGVGAGSVSGTKGGDPSNINNIDVMLRDVRSSSELCKRMHQVTGLDQRVYPKFISPLYWNRTSVTHGNFQLDPQLAFELDKYCQVYSEIKPGRTLQLCKHQGMVVLELSFRDGRKQRCEATLEQCSVVQQFDESTGTTGLTDQMIATRLQMDPQRVRAALQHWVNEGVLYSDGSNFIPRDLAQDQKQTGLGSSQGSTEEISNNCLQMETEAITDRDARLAATLEKIWPFIQGMLTNLGALKLEKIHSFLKVTTPKEVGYNMVTPSQLESHLHYLVEEGRLTCTSNDAYKLVK
ncbi:related to Anaphase-promoting complex subunit 2 [Zygosaccharomyces bailii]|nr:related to Anaphase-promoting complex subunit 2 [Zygosaccharomyces bailii]